MKQLLVVFILLTSFVSATVAEFSCLCVEDTETHASGSTTVENHHEHDDSSNADHQDHCTHTCNQCHFAALIPKRFKIQSQFELAQVQFMFETNYPREMHNTLYRPPIS